MDQLIARQRREWTLIALVGSLPLVRLLLANGADPGGVGPRAIGAGVKFAWSDRGLSTFGLP